MYDQFIAAGKKAGWRVAVEQRTAKVFGERVVTGWELTPIGLYGARPLVLALDDLPERWTHDAEEGLIALMRKAWGEAT